MAKKSIKVHSTFDSKFEEFSYALFRTGYYLWLFVAYWLLFHVLDMTVYSFITKYAISTLLFFIPFIKIAKKYLVIQKTDVLIIKNNTLFIRNTPYKFDLRKEYSLIFFENFSSGVSVFGGEIFLQQGEKQLYINIWGIDLEQISSDNKLKYIFRDKIKSREKGQKKIEFYYNDNFANSFLQMIKKNLDNNLKYYDQNETTFPDKSNNELEISSNKIKIEQIRIREKPFQEYTIKQKLNEYKRIITIKGREHYNKAIFLIVVALVIIEIFMFLYNNYGPGGIKEACNQCCTTIFIDEKNKESCISDCIDKAKQNNDFAYQIEDNCDSIRNSIWKD